jgi:hypothetical protein
MKLKFKFFFISLTDSQSLPSNSKFGWFFFFVFSTIALYSFYIKLKSFAIIFAIIGVFFIAVTLLAPKMLTPLNRIWYELGMLLGKIISPIVLGFIFFVLITPVSLITRLFGRDELKLKKISVQSYWTDRPRSGPESDSFKNQF